VSKVNSAKGKPYGRLRPDGQCQVHAVREELFGISAAHWDALLASGRASEENPQFVLRPIVKLRRADGSIQLLLALVVPEHPDRAFSLIQLGERHLLRTVSLSVIATESGDELTAAGYQSDLTLKEAALCARREGRIRDYAAEPCPFCNPDAAASAPAFQRVRLQHSVSTCQ
jgi:hypothetical protein